MDEQDRVGRRRGRGQRADPQLLRAAGGAHVEQQPPVRRRVGELRARLRAQELLGAGRGVDADQAAAGRAGDVAEQPRRRAARAGRSRPAPASASTLRAARRRARRPDPVGAGRVARAPGEQRVRQREHARAGRRVALAPAERRGVGDDDRVALAPRDAAAAERGMACPAGSRGRRRAAAAPRRPAAATRSGRQPRSGRTRCRRTARGALRGARRLAHAVPSASAQAASATRVEPAQPEQDRRPLAHRSRDRSAPVAAGERREADHRQRATGAEREADRELRAPDRRARCSLPPAPRRRTRARTS